jgi:aerobic carbon-monoxide dehydrogenase medium subunit
MVISFKTRDAIGKTNARHHRHYTTQAQIGPREEGENMFPTNISNYARPTSVDEALAAIKEYPDGDGIFIAGGQSLMQAIKSRIVRPEAIVDLQDVAELRGITIGDTVSIKPMTRYVEIAESTALPNGLLALRDAASHVGDRQVRNRGTIGGSLCWNYVASCLPCVALGLDASLHLKSASGAARVLSADDFLLGPLETDREEDEILVDIHFENVAQSGSAYKKWGLVTDSLPVVGVCASVTRDGDTCTQARLSFSGLTNGAERCMEAEALLKGKPFNQDSISAALSAAAENMETQSDQWADASYRERLMHTLGETVLNLAWQRAE